MSERTFSLQDSLPSLTVPTIDETMDRYLNSGKLHLLFKWNWSLISAATVLLTPEEKERAKKVVDEFRKSKHVDFMQMALEDRAKRERNWVRKILSFFYYDCFSSWKNGGMMHI